MVNALNWIYLGGVFFLMIFGIAAEKKACWIAGMIMGGLFLTYLIIGAFASI